METTASIPSKFSIVIKTTKCPYKARPNTRITKKSKTADGRHLGKIGKSPCPGNGLADRHEIYNDAV